MKLMDKVLKKAKDNRINQRELAEIIGVHVTTVQSWTYNYTTPQAENARRLRNFVEVGPREDRIKLDMMLIQVIEKKYGTISQCPERDPMLKKLHKQLGVTYKYSKFNTDKLIEDIEAQGETIAGINRKLGQPIWWFRNAMSRGLVTAEVATIAEYLGTEVKDYTWGDL